MPPRVETVRPEGKGMQENEGRLGNQLGVRGLKISRPVALRNREGAKTRSGGWVEKGG